jgi:hypothetical protein
VTSAIRNALTLAGCLAVLGVASGVALTALRSYDGPATRTGRVGVRVERWNGHALMQVRTLDSLRVGQRSGTDVVPAGTLLDVVAAALGEGGSMQATPPVGTRLDCDLRVGRSKQGETVVDVTNCVVNAAPNAQS